MRNTLAILQTQLEKIVGDLDAARKSASNSQRDGWPHGARTAQVLTSVRGAVIDLCQAVEMATKTGLEVSLSRAHEVLAMQTPSGLELIEALHHLTAQVEAGRSMLGAVKGRIAGEGVDQVFFDGVGEP